MKCECDRRHPAREHPRRAGSRYTQAGWASSTGHLLEATSGRVNRGDGGNLRPMGGGAILYAVLYCFSLSANSGHRPQPKKKRSSFSIHSNILEQSPEGHTSHPVRSARSSLRSLFCGQKTTHTPAKPDRLRIDGTLVVGSLGSVVL